MLRLLGTALLAATLVPAQITPQQRIDDLRTIAALYAKTYAPYEWKRDLLGFDLMNLTPWAERARRAKDDLEFYEVLVEYVASLQDTHDVFTLPTTFFANLGFTVDIYEGRVLIDSVNRTLLPAARFPFVIGDELVSVDGRTSQQWIDSFLRFVNNAHLDARRRVAAGWITQRSQARIPRAHEIGDEATVILRRAGGAEESYTIRWQKTGVPLTTIGPIPDIRASVDEPQPGDSASWTKYLEPWLRLQNVEVSGQETVLGSGQLNPLFAPPAGFTQRLGRAPTDYFYSGTFNAGGKRIGFIRIPRMSAFDGNSTRAILQYGAEMAFFNANTDGLIIDVMRNPGGLVSFVEGLCQFTIPTNFETIGFEIRATQSWVLSFQQAVAGLRQGNAPDWILALFEFYGKALETAYLENRGRTGPLPLGGVSLDLAPLPGAYTKPLIVLADDFSASGGDMFPAIIQDAGRGPIVGSRTSGAGGSVVNSPATAYSEGLTRVTQSLMVRPQLVTAPGYPTTPYVENVGVHPDVKLDFMTRENLVNSGRPFLEEVTRIILERIDAN